MTPKTIWQIVRKYTVQSGLEKLVHAGPLLLRLYVLVIFVCACVIVAPPPATSAVNVPDYFDYQVEFPPAPRDGDEAAATLSQRAAAVVDFLACGREFDFMKRTLDPSPGARAAEDYFSVILAKIAWLQTRQAHECRARVTVSSEDFPPRSPGDPTPRYIKRPDIPPGQSFRLELRTDWLNSDFQSAFGAVCAVEAFGPYEYRKFVSPTNLFGHLFVVDLVVPRECLRAQVNAALMKVAVVGTIGSSDIPCGRPGPGGFAVLSHGEWDVSVRDLTRIFYVDRRGGGVLDPDTQKKIRDELLTISGPMGPHSYSPYSCGNQEMNTGSPQDLADDRDWGWDVLDAIGDFFKWLFSFLSFLLTFGLATAATFIVPGGVIALPAVTVLATGSAFSEIAESENHLLMIETSRYLKNQIVIEVIGPDYDNVDVFEDDQKDIKAWLLTKMQDVVTRDFEEFNARPYQRYSINALMNLADFANDTELKTAARMTLEYANAKFAVGSLDGRRIVPFRRLLEVVAKDIEKVPPRRVFDFDSVSDHQVAQMLLFTGQTQQLPERQPPANFTSRPLPAIRLASIASVTEMIYTATSEYRPHPLVLDLAIRKIPGTYQRIRHHAWEAYSSGRGFLITAGGVQVDAAHRLLGIALPNDMGAAMPTTLMLSLPDGAADRQRFIRIEGTRVQSGDNYSFEHNLCVWRGFACGTNIKVPELRSPQGEDCVKAGEPGWRFLDTRCLDPLAPRTFVAIYTQPCPDDPSCNFGLVEAVDAEPNAMFLEFMTTVAGYNRPGFVQPTAIRLPFHEPTYTYPGVYQSYSGHKIGFNAAIHHIDQNRWGIEAIDSAPVTGLADWPPADGDVITRVRNDAGEGVVRIRNVLRNQDLILDFQSKSAPKRIPPP